MRRFTSIASLLLPLAVLAGHAAHAAEVWRCGPEGRSYGDAPCPQGQVLPALQPRPAADVAHAQRQAEQDRRSAQRLARERELREAASIAATARPANLGPQRPAAQSLPAPHRLAKMRPHPRSTAPAGEETSPSTALWSPRKPG